MPQVPDGFEVFPSARAMADYENYSLRRDNEQNPAASRYLEESGDSCPSCGDFTIDAVDGYRTCPSCDFIGTPTAA